MRRALIVLVSGLIAVAAAFGGFSVVGPSAALHQPAAARLDVRSGRPGEQHPASLALLPGEKGLPFVGAPAAAPATAVAIVGQGSIGTQRTHGLPVPSPGPRQAGITMHISRLGVHAPIFDRGQDSEGNMVIAPGYALTHFKYSGRLGAKGNYVVYGHDDIEGEILRYLPDMRIGDRIDVYRGRTHYQYQVVDREIVPPSDVSVMDVTAEPVLTLISCYPYRVDTRRIIVVASLVLVHQNGVPGS